MYFKWSIGTVYVHGGSKGFPRNVTVGLSRESYILHMTHLYFVVIIM